MKQSLVLAAAGIAGVLLCTPVSNAHADLNLHLNIGGSPAVVVDRSPDFIYLDDYGLAVSWGWNYDVIRYDGLYFIYRDGGWFRSPSFRGPWSRVRNWDLPYQIRRHNWNDIRRRRDLEYRKQDRTYWNRHFEEQRIRDRRPDSRPGFRPDGRPDFRPGDRPDGRPDSRPDGRPDFRPDGRPQPQDQPQGRPDQRPDGRPDFRPDGRPDQRPQPQNQPQGRPDQRPDGRPDYRPDGRPQSQDQPQGRPDQRPDGRPDSRPDGRPDGRP
ncbi:MAG: hypothetical protein WBP54_03850 [Pelodictyon phaeoclathratiforme]